MSLLTTVPEELLAAAAQLGMINSSLATQNAGAAAATTVIAPAAADPVSAQQAGIFSTFGTLYQQIAAEAQAIQEQFVQTLGLSSGTYSTTEASNAAQSGIGNFINSISTLLGGPSSSVNGHPFSLSGNFANLFDVGGENWASSGSDLLGMAGGGLLPAAPAAPTPAAGGAAAGAASGAATGAATATGAVTAPAGMGAMPVTAGVGQATMVGKLSAPPSWASSVAGTSAAPLETVGWTAAAPQTGAGTVVPGMPGMASAARNGAGLGAPRYGVKPIVMPKPTAV